MAPISKLLQTLSFVTLFLMLANQQVLSQDATSFTYKYFTQSTTGLTYQGAVHVPPGSTVLRLTETDSSGYPIINKAGRVLYSRPVKFWERSPARQATFETTISFFITPSSYAAADGLAFFIAPINSSIPSGTTGVAGNLGIFGSTGNTTSLFAVEFDTFSNPWDPSYPHIGIDLESRNSTVLTRFDSATGLPIPVTARINYDAITKTISVVATSSQQTASLSYVFDLKTILPEQVQVGISSATGAPVANIGVHDVISWSFSSSLGYTNVKNEEKAYIQKYMGMY